MRYRDVIGQKEDWTIGPLDSWTIGLFLGAIFLDHPLDPLFCTILLGVGRPSVLREGWDESISNQGGWEADYCYGEGKKTNR